MERLGSLLIILTFVLFELSLISIAHYQITKIIIVIITVIVAGYMLYSEFKY